KRGLLAGEGGPGRITARGTRRERERAKRARRVVKWVQETHKTTQRHETRPRTTATAWAQTHAPLDAIQRARVLHQTPRAERHALSPASPGTARPRESSVAR